MNSPRRTTVAGLSLPEGKKAEDLNLQGGRKEEGPNPPEGKKPDGQSLPGKKRQEDQNRRGGKSRDALSLPGVRSQGIPDGTSKEEKIGNLKRDLREGQNHLDQRLAGTPASQVEVDGEAHQERERVRGKLRAKREEQKAWREIHLPRGGGKMEGTRIRIGKKEEGSLHHQLQMEQGERIKVEDQILPGGKRMRTGEGKLRSRKRS